MPHSRAASSPPHPTRQATQPQRHATPRTHSMRALLALPCLLRNGCMRAGQVGHLLVVGLSSLAFGLGPLSSSAVVLFERQMLRLVKSRGATATI